METFGERLANLRKHHNLSQSELAQILKISKSALGMYEINHRQPSFETLIEIAIFFGVTTDYLILGKTNK